MERYGTCSLCHEEYGKNLSPRVLTCGHSYCTDCLEKLIRNGNGTFPCPTCLKTYHVSNVSEIAINFALEESLSKLAEMNLSMSASIAHKSIDIKGKRMERLIVEQKSNAIGQQALTGILKRELLDYDVFLCDSTKKYEEIAISLHTLATNYESKAKEMKEERMKIAQVLDEADANDKEMEDNLQYLESAVIAKADSPNAMIKVMECAEQLKEWIEKCQKLFPDLKIASVDEPYQGQAKASVISTDLKNMEKEKTAYLKKIALNLRKTFCDSFAGKMRQRHWMQIIASGKLVAIDSRDGIQRWANLSLKENRVYLHHLRKTDDLPAASALVKHSEFIESLNKEETLTFMDLKWDGSIQGRIHILLSPDTPLARNFRILCTGELGHTYANTQFSHTYEDLSSHYIVGGNYERDRGGSGRAVIEGINFSDSVYERQNADGLVFSEGSSNNASQFAIIIFNRGRYKRGNVFGKLKDGKQIMKKAYHTLKANRTVEITDCGVVLSH